MKQLRAFAAFWYDFIVGDDWRIAAGVVLGLASPRFSSTPLRSTPGGFCSASDRTCATGWVKRHQQVEAPGT
jgi:hypothetical protein